MYMCGFNLSYIIFTLSQCILHKHGLSLMFKKKGFFTINYKGVQNWLKNSSQTNKIFMCLIRIDMKNVLLPFALVYILYLPNTISFIYQ